MSNSLVSEYIVAHQNGELALMDRIEVGCEVDYRRFFPELGSTLRGELDIVFNEKEIGDWKTVNQNMRNGSFVLSVLMEKSKPIGTQPLC